MSAPTISELWRAVQEHPDYLFGTMFARDDVPQGRKLRDDFQSKQRKFVDKYLTHVGKVAMLTETEEVTYADQADAGVADRGDPRPG